jgi:hypothetical protein
MIDDDGRARRSIARRATRSAREAKRARRRAADEGVARIDSTKNRVFARFDFDLISFELIRIISFD